MVYHIYIIFLWVLSFVKKIAHGYNMSIWVISYNEAKTTPYIILIYSLVAYSTVLSLSQDILYRVDASAITIRVLV
jgi:hypothetical protein